MGFNSVMGFRRGSNGCEEGWKVGLLRSMIRGGMYLTSPCQCSDRGLNVGMNVSDR